MNKTCCTHFLILTLSIFALSSGWGQSSPFLMQTFDEEVTKTSKTNFMVTQNKQGQIMLANIRGLLRYNGQKWQLNGFNDTREVLIQIGRAHV